MALRRENSPAEIRGSVSRRRNANFELRRRVLCGPAQGKQSDRVFRAGETQILNCRDAFCVALRRRNANFDLRRRIFCPDEVDSRGVTTGWTKSPRRYSESRKKYPSRSFAQAKRKFWPPEVRFLWPCAVKNEADKKKHLDLRGFTLTVRTPQCDTLFGEKACWVAHTFLTAVGNFNLHILNTQSLLGSWAVRCWTRCFVRERPGHAIAESVVCFCTWLRRNTEDVIRWNCSGAQELLKYLSCFFPSKHDCCFKSPSGEQFRVRVWNEHWLRTLKKSQFWPKPYL